MNDETEDTTFPGSIKSKTEVTDPRKHNLRRKPRKNYRELNEGIHNITNSAYSKIDPPKYAWDSFDDDSDDYDEIIQFQSWCKLQPQFIPPNQFLFTVLKINTLNWTQLNYNLL